MSDGGATTRVKDGREWRIGEAADLEWIENATHLDSEICCGIPPCFESYCTVALPQGIRGAQLEHDRAVVGVLQGASRVQPWWLGYLENGIGVETVFYDVPTVMLYGDPYVFVQAGPQEALSWRVSEGRRAPPKGALPDVMFPADHAWLLSTLWDDLWSCIGGPRALIGALASNPVLAPRTRMVPRGEKRKPHKNADTENR